MTAPYPFHTEIKESVAQKLLCRLGNDSLPPIFLTKPITELVFIVMLREILPMQPDATDRLTAFLKANGIGLIRGKDCANDFKAVFNARMSGPPRRISDVLIARIFIKIFGIALTPRA
jgi:hypothetical protein